MGLEYRDRTLVLYRRDKEYSSEQNQSCPKRINSVGNVFIFLNMGNTGPKNKTLKERGRVRSQWPNQVITEVNCLSYGVKGCWNPKPDMSSYPPFSKVQRQ